MQNLKTVLELLWIAQAQKTEKKVVKYQSDLWAHNHCKSQLLRPEGKVKKKKGKDWESKNNQKSHSLNNTKEGKGGKFSDRAKKALKSQEMHIDQPTRKRVEKYYNSRRGSKQIGIEQARTC